MNSQNLIESSVISFELLILGLIGTILFGIASKKQPALLNWFYVFVLSSLGLLFNFLKNYLYDIRYLSFLSYAFAIIVATFTIIKEYRTIFPQNVSFKLRIILLLASLELSITISLISLVVIVLLIDLIFQIKIAIKADSLTYGFICIILFGALLTFFGNIFINLEFEGASIINDGIDLFFSSALLLTGMVALLEGKIRESEIMYKKAFNSANFYKDLVSHDFKNILQNIRSSIELLLINTKDSYKDNQNKEILAILEEQVIRGSNLVSNIKKLSEIDDMNLELEKINILDYIKTSIAYYKKSFQERDLEITLSTGDDEFFIKGNDLLSEVIDNILYNGIKHNERKKIRIEIVVSEMKDKEGRYVKVQFIDNGIGIPNESKKMLFNEKYEKNQRVKGRGLGLSLVFKIIKSLNGKIWIEDKVKGDYNQGSKFVILLPLA